MEERLDPEEVRLLVKLLRSARGWTPEQMAAAARMHPSSITRYEAGTPAPRPRRLRQLIDAAAIPMPYVQHVLVPVARALRAFRDSLSESFFEDLGAAVEELGTELSAAALVEVTTFLAELQDPEEDWERTGPPREEDRLRAADLWPHLESCASDEDRLFLVETCPEYQTWAWALAERLCHESERAAAGNATVAATWSNLAWRVAELAPLDDIGRSRLQGYVLLFVANVERVRGSLRAAEETFDRAQELWQAGAGGLDLLASWRLPDLKASLCRAQRQFQDALQLHDDALALGPEAAGRILLKKSATLEQMGEAEQALAVLEKAAPHVERDGEPRELFALWFNRAAILCDLDRIAEAAELLPRVRELAEGLGNEPDLVRVRWLEGRVAAGLGRLDEAVAALEQVRQDFERLEMFYDCALASVKLAWLYLEQGRTAEVKTLVAEAEPVFRSLDVHREALAGFLLFRQAVEKEAATADLAQRLFQYLQEARRDPGTPFKP